MLTLELRDSAWALAQLPPPPSPEPPEGYQVGDIVRLGFQGKSGQIERGWVKITVVGALGLEGRLLQSLHYLPKMFAGSRIAFGSRHILAHRFPTI